MPSKTVSRDLNDQMYFVTMTICKWYYIFDRHDRWDILSKSIKYCQKNKELQIFSYVFMLNHIHLIIKSPNVAGFLRDFKKYTARKLMESIEENEPRVAKLFKLEKEKYQIWEKTNMPILIQNEKVYLQKVQYIEYNPVRKGYVEFPENWKYSSANPNSLIKCNGIQEV